MDLVLGLRGPVTKVELSGSLHNKDHNQGSGTLPDVEVSRFRASEQRFAIWTWTELLLNVQIGSETKG